MGLRGRRAAGLRRGARGRALARLGELGVYAAAGVVAAWPAVREADERFLTLPADAYSEAVAASGGEASAGDHLQLTWGFWLAGHQLARAEPPWLDPYSFRPESEPQLWLGGWLLAPAWWALEPVAGAVGAWNGLQLLGFVLAGALTAAWLRELGLGRLGALAGGLAFALAPYRVVQSANHLLGLVAFLLPLALWAFERGLRGSRAWHVLAAAALAAIPLSGQSHLALAAVPFAVAVALVRARRAWPLVLGLPAVGAGLLAGRTAVEGSIAEGGRTLRAVDSYSPEWADLVSREVRGDVEQFVLLGWATPVLAAAGAALLWRARRRALAGVLAAGFLAALVLALGTTTPLYEPLWEALPPLQYPRVPERVLPAGLLALAALAGAAVDRARGTALAIALAALVVVDLRAGVDVYAAVPAGRAAAYHALADAPPGRLLELPVLEPHRHFGAVYLWDAMQAPRERPQGYSTTAPIQADAVAGALAPLSCGRWTTPRGRLLRSLGVRYVAVHRGVYRQQPFHPPRCAAGAERALRAHGWEELADDGTVAIYRRARG